MAINTKNTFLLTALWISLMTLYSGCAKLPKIDLNTPQERASAINAYLDEFSAPSFTQNKIGAAIREVMLRMPEEALAIIMNRRRPVIFVDVYSSGLGQIASSSEFIVTKKDLPAFQQGMTLIKISDLLEDGSPKAITGIIAHEIAHRVLDHIRQDQVSCQAERETNRLIKSWGFTEEFKAASQEFGQSRIGTDSPICQ